MDRADRAGHAERVGVPGAAPGFGLASGPPPDGDPLAHQGSLQRCADARDVRRGAGLLELRLCALARFDGPLLVDLLGMLREVGEDDHLVRADLHEASRYEEDLLGAALLDAQLPRAPRTVSLRSTYLPGRPVNCSATNIGWLM